MNHYFYTSNLYNIVHQLYLNFFKLKKIKRKLKEIVENAQAVVCFRIPWRPGWVPPLIQQVWVCWRASTSDKFSGGGGGGAHQTTLVNQWPKELAKEDKEGRIIWPVDQMSCVEEILIPRMNK